MRRFCAITLLLASAAFIGAAPPSSPFPVPPTPSPTPQPLPGGVLNLTVDAMYVVDWPEDGVLRAHPAELVTLKKIKGPVWVNGKFADSNGKVELREFKGPSVYVVSSVAGAKGRVELDYIPFGFKAETDIFSTAVDVNGGNGPRPPPDPDVDPKPTPVKVDSVFVVVVENAAVGRTVETAQALNDPFWKTLKPQHDWRHYLSTSQTAKDNGYVDTLKSVGYPGVLILNAKDGAVLNKFKLTTAAAIDVAVKEVAK